MSVTILGKVLTNEKALAFSFGFLRAQPNSEMVDDPLSTEETPLPRIHKYTDLQWLHKRGYDYMMREYRQGMKSLANDTAIIDEDIFGE